MADTLTDLHRSELEDVSALAMEAVEGLLEMLEDEPLAEWARILREVLPQIVENYGAIAGELAVLYYNQERAALLTIEEQRAARFQASSELVPTDSLRTKFVDASNALIGKVFNGINTGELVKEQPETSETSEPEENTTTTRQVDEEPEPPRRFSDLPEEDRIQFKEELNRTVVRDTMNYSRETLEITANEDPADVEPYRSLNAGACKFCHDLESWGMLTDYFHKGCRCTTGLRKVEG